MHNSDTDSTNNTKISAAMLAIGDELLSGRTKDKNIGYLADTMNQAGIQLEEVRIVGDDLQKIAESVNALRHQYTYLFTSGGIGPTHDDITADAIALAFGVECIYDDAAMELLARHYAERGVEFTPARQRMARMPKGSQHIPNPVSSAPGFQIENVYIMAGVPSVFQAMLNAVLPKLKKGRKLFSKSIVSRHGEGVIGTELGEIQRHYDQTMIGSYPKFINGRFSTELVVRSHDISEVDKAIVAINAMLKKLDG